MRLPILSVLVLILLLGAPAAVAAPTCQDRNGEVARCGTPGAMPVGWTPSPQRLLDWQSTRPPGPSTGEVLEIFAVIALFLAMIALMPEFDGTRAADWDRQESDDENSN